MIVMKFGGTSVQDAGAITRVGRIVRGRLKQGPVVVVSAMAKVTDQLQAMGRDAAAGHLEAALERARALRHRHEETAADLLPRRRLQPLLPDLHRRFDELETLLRGIAAVGELTPRTSDYVLSFGELLSSAIVAAAFSASGMDAVLVDSRECVVTDAQHTRAVPLFRETNERLVTRVRPLVEAGKVPVMAGFIGATVEGTTTTVGRGGSDFSAAIVGAALDCERIEIWTDVDGVKTTDPNLCVEARRLDEISFDEAAEMAFFGAKVLHPATLVPAMQKNIPVYVLNSLNPRSKGTCVRAHTQPSRSKVKAITAKKGLTIINITAARHFNAHGFLHDVFQRFKNHQIQVDIVATSEVSVSVTVDSKLHIGALVEDLRQFTDVDIEPNKAIVCVIGEDLRGTPGMLAKVFTAIRDINVRMVSQGSSEINISFVIEESDVPEAVRRLHRLLFAPARRKANAKVKLGPEVTAAAARASAAVNSLVFRSDEDDLAGLSCGIRGD